MSPWPHFSCLAGSANFAANIQSDRGDDINTYYWLMQKYYINQK